MATWSLKNKHYLNVEGTEWEYREIGNSGRQKRMIFPVPLHLDPDEPADQTPPGSGQVLVSDGSNPLPNAIVFSGPPTPDMEPLDEEARALSAKLPQGWVNPIESIGSSEAYGDKLIRVLEELTAQRATQQPSSPVPEAKHVEALEAQNAEMAAQLAAYQARDDAANVRRP